MPYVEGISLSCEIESDELKKARDAAGNPTTSTVSIPIQSDLTDGPMSRWEFEILGLGRSEQGEVQHPRTQAFIIA